MIAGSAARGRRAACVVGTILALIATGCNGGDGDGGGSKSGERPGDKPAIRNLLVTAFKSDDPDRLCSRVFTRQLFRQIFESTAACRKVVADDEDEEPPKRVEVSGIDVSGQRGRARARLVGGETAGAAGVVSVAREEEAWRLDDLSIGFLRSSVKAGLAHQKDIPGPVAGCIGTRLARVPDGRFKDFAYGSLGRRPDSERFLLTMLTACERAEGRPPTIRREIDQEVAKSLRQAGVKPQVVRCVLGRLRRSLSDEKLIDVISADVAERRARLRRLLVAAVAGCRGARGGQGGSIS